VGKPQRGHECGVKDGKPIINNSNREEEIQECGQYDPPTIENSR
jgi:hypothetical protein